MLASPSARASALAMFALTCCGIADVVDDVDSNDAPEIPADFPQLSEVESARIVAVVDGQPFEDAGLCRYGSTLGEAGPRFVLNVGAFEVSVAGREVGTYSSDAEEVTAVWLGVEQHDSGPECGDSVVRFEGEQEYDGIRDDELATWGTLQLILCNWQGDMLEVSGKFSCAL